MKKRWIVLALCGSLLINLWTPCSVQASGNLNIGEDLEIEEGVEEWDDEDWEEDDESKEEGAVVKPGRVKSMTVANAQTGVRISWAKSKDADGYIIYRKMKGSSAAYKEMKKITKNSTLKYTDKDVKQGNGYIYNICAYVTAKDGSLVKGDRLAAAKKIVYAKMLSVKNQKSSVKLSWTKISEAAGYKVYRKLSGESKYSYIKTLKSSGINYYVDKDGKAIKNGKTASYYVKPYYEKSNGYVLQTDKKTNCYVTSTAFSTVTGAKKAISLKWKKNSQASGYQIYYSTDKNFKSYKLVTVKSKNTVSKKISGLAAKKTYYVKVRAYKTYNNVKYYSAWSAVKSVKSK